MDMILTVVLLNFPILKVYAYLPKEREIRIVLLIRREKYGNKI
jgi:hypothetical protein